MKGLVSDTKHFRLVDRNDERTEFCTVLGLIRHELSNVCTWKSAVLHKICDKAKVLLEDRKHSCSMAGQYKAFESIYNVCFGKAIHGSL